MDYRDYIVLDENNEIWSSASSVRDVARIQGVTPKRVAEMEANHMNEEAGRVAYRAVVVEEN